MTSPPGTARSCR
ncbi:hypothetical protein EYF80_067784 [Liparis tanakae]|uniref:Uncharacterized protein n=1 Tax=Liparis tanakae TaxID=230148 RepID=A0A4Z2E011_9TELE|nr:hypothetical protein EYF80_067784 [Liparis tanakae]